MRTTPENITELATDEVFVFGSNDRGIHGRGAALTAKLRFGAKQGVGEGPTGQCYALPTLNVAEGRFRLIQRTEDELTESIRQFYQYAADNPDKIFLLTRVGCGLAGYDENQIKELFRAHVRPPNIIFPRGW